MPLVRLIWIALVLASSGTAAADKKLQEITPALVREAAACQVQANGISKVLAGARTLAKTAEGAELGELERDISELMAGAAQVTIYCEELAGIVKFLEENAKAPYKSVERELDQRYTKVRDLRISTKKLVEDLAPISRKLIPKIAHRPAAPSEPKRVPGKFPSGRVVELPALPGTWRLAGSGTTDTAEYRETPAMSAAISASVTTRPFPTSSCDQQRQALLANPDAEGIVDLELVGSKDLGIAWGMRYTRRERSAVHLVSVMCLPNKSGGVMATSDVVPAERAELADELVKLMLRMIAQRR